MTANVYAFKEILYSTYSVIRPIGTTVVADASEIVSEYIYFRLGTANSIDTSLAKQIRLEWNRNHKR